MLNVDDMFNNIDEILMLELDGLDCFLSWGKMQLGGRFKKFGIMF